MLYLNKYVETLVLSCLFNHIKHNVIVRGGRALSYNPAPEQFKSRVLKFACIYIIFNKIYIMTLPTNANW